MSDDGYQPAGIRPASLSVPVAVATPAVSADRSNTATAFASASAANRRVPSAESASAFGVAPSPGPDGGGSSNRATTFRDFVSTTATWSVLPDATNSRLPSRFNSSADGCRATGMRPESRSWPSGARVNAETVLPPHADTYTVPSASTTTSYG